MRPGRRRKEAEHPNSAFGDALKALLEKTHMTQKELAHESFIAEGTLSKMIKGQRLHTPSVRSHLRQILFVLARKGAIHSVEEADEILASIPTMSALDERDNQDTELIAYLREQAHPVSPVHDESGTCASTEEREKTSTKAVEPVSLFTPLHHIQRYNRPARSWMLVCIFLVLVVAIGGLILDFTPSAFSTLSLLSVEATHSRSTSTPQTLYNHVIREQPLWRDSLSRQDSNTWDDATDSLGGCSFRGNAYHINVRKPHMLVYCVAKGSTFCNVAVQVQTRLLAGFASGIVIRVTDQLVIRFFMTVDGSYYVENQTGKRLLMGQTPGIQKGYQHVNVLTIIAQAGSILLYGNAQYIGRVTDANPTCGYVGFLAVSYQQPTEVLFQNVQVWKL